VLNKRPPSSNVGLTLVCSSIVCRSFQGIGGAGLYSLTTICLPEIGPAHKPDVIGKIIGITLSLSFVLGPVLGGFIPQVSSWRVIYWLK
jgi:MFS family permease